jgi:hypothetical protein
MVDYSTVFPIFVGKSINHCGSTECRLQYLVAELEKSGILRVVLGFHLNFRRRSSLSLIVVYSTPKRRL